MQGITPEVFIRCEGKCETITKHEYERLSRPTNDGAIGIRYVNVIFKCIKCKSERVYGNMTGDYSILRQ